MRQECEDCGVCLVLEGDTEIWFGTCRLEGHAERQTSVLGRAGDWDKALSMGDRKELEGVPEYPDLSLEDGADGRLSPTAFS